jgi:hypothetical protein
MELSIGMKIFLIMTRKKQIRYRYKYTGRNVNGKPVRFRDALNSSDAISSPSSRSINSYNYGEFLPLQKIIDELKIGSILVICSMKKTGI